MSVEQTHEKGRTVSVGSSKGSAWHVRIPMRFGIHGEIVGYCMIDPRASDWLAAQALAHQKGPEVSVVVHMPSRQITEMALCFSPASPNTLLGQSKKCDKPDGPIQ